MSHFSGSYPADDVQFLLKPLSGVATLSVAEKESRIQSGGHYSEMLSPESAPTEAYLRFFEQHLHATKTTLAHDLLRLARYLDRTCHTEQLVLVSLARAGTPLGVLLTRTLRAIFGRAVQHYSVSIIRDRGLDLNALRYIHARHPAEAIRFLDGWTGKGVIGEELRRSVAQFNAQNGVAISSALHVLADIAGTADVCASRDDYLLPSAILNAPVSGLISRTVLNADLGPDDFHGCLFLEELKSHDQSQYFVETVLAEIRTSPLPEDDVIVRKGCNPGAELACMVAKLMAQYSLSHRNYVKPGVGEATRVMLRRVPKVLLLRDQEDAAVQHLLHLASTKRVPVTVVPNLACKAVALIEQLD